MNINTLNRTLVLLKRLFDTSVSTETIIPLNPQKPAVARTPAEQPFPRATPESQGVPSGTILSFVEELHSHRELEMHNLLILRNGKIIYENSFGSHDYHLWKNTYSECKSITSLAIGLLADEGKLSVDDKVINILEDVVPLGARIKFKNLTVEDLLTMRSTVIFNEASSMATTEWIKGFFNSSTSGETGRTFNYNSLNSYILSVIVNKLSGMSMSLYLEEKLFRPMGITGYFWEKCPQGIEKGGWGLYIRPEDIAKLGQLVLNKGMWKGQRLISEEWLNKATASHCTTPAEYGKYDYGYHIWVDCKNNAFLFNGMLSQNVMGFKDSGILIVSNAGIAEMFQQSNYYDIACKHLGGSFSSVLPEDNSAHRKLTPSVGRFRKIFNFSQKNKDISPEFRFLDGKLYSVDQAPSTGLFPVFLQTVQNNYTKGTRAVGFRRQEGHMVMTYYEEDETHVVPIGFSQPIISDLEFHGEPYRVAVSGTCTENEDGIPVLKISIVFMETPCTRILKFYHDGISLMMKCCETPGTNFLMGSIKILAQGMMDKPIVGTTLSKLDYDYINYKIYRLFEPTLNLREKE